MKRYYLLAAAAALLVTAGIAHAKEGMLKIGEPISVGGAWCFATADWRDIKNYAEAHGGDGVAAWTQKVKAGQCGKASFAEATPTKVLSDIAWKDVRVGDVVVVQFSVSIPDGSKKDAYGLFGPEQIDQGTGV